MRSFLMTLGVAAVVLAGSVHADVIMFDLDGGQEGDWHDFLSGAGRTPVGGWDFDLDPDYGQVDFQGPLTSLGAGPVSPGIISNDNIVMTGGFMAIGPSAPFHNPSNGILANQVDQGFPIELPFIGSNAIEFNAISILGNKLIDTVVRTTQGEYVFGDLAAPTRGHRYAFAVTGGHGEEILSVLLYSPDGAREGIQGQGIIYVPAPGALAAVAAALLGCRRRRRA